MGGAGEAGVVEPDAVFNPVEQPFREPVAADMPPGDVGDGAVHGPAVVAGGDDQVDPRQQAVPVHLIVVDECPARGLRHADPFGIVHLAAGQDSADRRCPGRPAVRSSAPRHTASRSDGPGGSRELMKTAACPPGKNRRACSACGASLKGATFRRASGPTR